jgi:hypothetical protein
MGLITIMGKDTEFNALIGRVRFPLLDADLDVQIDDGADLEYAERCAQAMQAMPEPLINELCAATIRYCECVRESCGEDYWFTGVPRGLTGTAILNHVSKAGTMIIDAPDGAGVGYRFELECDWEPEHGLDWSILNDEVVYVGEFSDNNPWRGRHYFQEANSGFAELTEQGATLATTRAHTAVDGRRDE